jgi:hypothetical protein
LGFDLHLEFLGFGFASGRDFGERLVVVCVGTEDIGLDFAGEIEEVTGKLSNVSGESRVLDVLGVGLSLEGGVAVVGTAGNRAIMSGVGRLIETGRLGSLRGVNLCKDC